MINSSIKIKIDNNWKEIKELYQKIDNQWIKAKQINSKINNNWKQVGEQYKIYGVQIDETNSNPTTCCSYFGDSVGKSAGYSAWQNTEIMQNLKPCILKDGKVVRYLDKNDYTKDIFGNTVKLNDINIGDIMVEIPKFGYKFQRIGDKLNISLTNNPKDPDFCYLAHSLNEIGDCDKIYYGVYLNSRNGNIMYSHSGKTPTHSLVINALRPLISVKGEGYQLQSLYPRTLLSVLYLIVYKNLNSQQALGKGYCIGGKACNATGTSNKKGFCWGEQTGKINNNIKLFGIEDVWGNLQDWIDGVFLDSTYTLKTTYKNFNNNGANYLYSSKLSYNSDQNSKFCLKCQGTNELGFLPQIIGGNNTQGFCDYVQLRKNMGIRTGGQYSLGDKDGLFYACFDQAPAGSTGAGQGSRIIYKHKTSSITNIEATIIITSPANSKVIITGNGKSYQQQVDSSGKVVFNINKTGNYMVSNNIGNTMGIPKLIEVKDNVKNYNITL